MNKCRCKMCGNVIDISTKDMVYKCNVCNYDNFINYGNVCLITNLFGRINLLMEESIFDKAMELINKVLNIEYDNAYAYYLALLCDLKTSFDILHDDIISNTNFIFALKYGNDYLKEKLEILRKENSIDDDCKYKYIQATRYFENKEYEKALKTLSLIYDYEPASKLMDEVNKCNVIDKENKYQQALECLKKYDYDNGLKLLNEVKNYKKIDDEIAKYQELAKIDNLYKQYKSLIQKNNDEQFLIRAFYFFQDHYDYRDSNLYAEKLNKQIIEIRKSKSNNANYSLIFGIVVLIVVFAFLIVIFALLSIE